MKAWKHGNVYYIMVQPNDVLRQRNAPVNSTGASPRMSTVIMQRLAAGIVTLLLMALAVAVFCITKQR